MLLPEYEMTRLYTIGFLHAFWLTSLYCTFLQEDRSGASPLAMYEQQAALAREAVITPSGMDEELR